MIYPHGRKSERQYAIDDQMDFGDEGHENGGPVRCIAFPQQSKVLLTVP